MKILIITTRFYPHVGGVEEVVSNIAKNLNTDSNEVSVLSSLDQRVGLRDFGKILKISQEEEQISTYKNKRIWLNLPGSVAGLLLFPARFFLSLVELFSYTLKFDPSVINYHFPDDSSVYVDLLTSVLKTPLVVNIHGNDLHIYSQKRLHRFFIGRLLKRAKTIIVNSSYMKSEFIKRYPKYTDKIKIIPNGLNVEAYEKAEKKAFIGDPYVFYVGRIVEKKGVDLLVKAFYKLKNSNLKLVIEGKGEELPKIKNMVKGLGLEKDIIFTNGEMLRKEKIETMKSALFGVVPSRVEPFGIVALEFMAAGTPFVASKTGGLNDLLRDGETCLFFENGNIDDLADKMELMLSDHLLRERLIASSQSEVQNYQWGTISSRYLNCFDELL